MNTALQELMQIRGRDDDGNVTITGKDPVYSTTFRVGDTAAAVLAATGVAASDIWEMKTGRRQSVSVNVRHAAAAVDSVGHMQFRQEDGSFKVKQDSPLAQMAYDTVKAYPTRDGRWFLPHFGLQHLKKRVLGLLDCDFDQESIARAVAKRDAQELEDTLADADTCGGMVRTEEEWLAHPHGQVLGAQAVVEIEKIGESDPEPFPEGGRLLEGIRVLDLTRILAGPVAARSLSELGADVLMIAAQHIPQFKKFFIDLSHGKRSCFLDLNDSEEAVRLKELVRGADVFSQGYRPGVLNARGFGPEELAALRPGLVYTSINCYGEGGPFSNRGGWEQVAQTVTGISHEISDPPSLLPVFFCDYNTGYLGAYGTLLALARRAVEGGSYHVKVSLCQTAMFLQRQGQVSFDQENMGLSEAEIRPLQIESDTSYGHLRHLGPVIRYSETKPGWKTPSPALGSSKAEWLQRG